jgi:hypothetical protein
MKTTLEKRDGKMVATLIGAKMIIRNQPTDSYCRCDAQTPMCKRWKLS